MPAVQLCLSLLALLALSGVVARHVPVPRPFVQIGVGALAAWPTHGLHIELEPDLFLLLLIPPLLFVDAWRMPKRELIRERTPIMLLAIGLVLFTILGVGNLVHWMYRMALQCINDHLKSSNQVPPVGAPWSR